jgi:hypothetical protein
MRCLKAKRGEVRFEKDGTQGQERRGGEAGNARKE